MSNDHFAIIGDRISPQPWMQLRVLKTVETPSVSRSYDTSGGGNKNDLVQTVDAKWTNNTPIAQHVYGMVSRGGAQVTLQARSRGYLSTAHAVDITPTPTPPTTFDMLEVSRFGCGLDAGKGGSLGTGTGFGVQEHRQNSTTIPLMPHATGLYRVEPGETFHARVVLRFVTQFWENTAIDGGEQSTESLFISGDTRVDLFGLPAVSAPPVRPEPSIVGVEYDIRTNASTTVDVPAGTAEGDVIVAVVANHLGIIGDINPGQPGWVLRHNRDGGGLDAHLKVFWRVATGDEPDSYTFGNAALAEEIAHLIVIRGASPYLEDGWQFASAMRKHFWERDDGHAAPSFDRKGQLLLCVSYVPHGNGQNPVTQTSPAGMTELSDVSGNVSSCAVAVLLEPPRPTQERKFVTSKTPQWAGRSITVSILVPGAPAVL